MAHRAASVPVKIVNVHGRTVTGAEIEYIEKVSDILDRLREAGEKRVCTLLLGNDELELPRTLRQSGFADESNQVTVVFWTVNGLKTSGFPVKSLIDSDPQSKSCRSRKGFKPEGYTMQELLATGFTVKDLKLSGCTPLSLITAGCSLGDLKDAGFRVTEIKDTCRSVFGSDACKTMKQLKELGYEVSDLRMAGYTLKEIRASSCYKVAELAQAGYNLYDFYDGGYTVLEILDLNCPVRDLKRVGYDAAQMKQAGYKAGTLREVGYPIHALKRGGFTVVDLREAGFSCWVIGSSGYTVRQLRSGGFGDQDISEAGFTECGGLKTAGTNRIQSERHAITV